MLTSEGVPTAGNPTVTVNVGEMLASAMAETEQAPSPAPDPVANTTAEAQPVVVETQEQAQPEEGPDEFSGILKDLEGFLSEDIPLPDPVKPVRQVQAQPVHEQPVVVLDKTNPLVAELPETWQDAATTSPEMAMKLNDLWDQATEEYARLSGTVEDKEALSQHIIGKYTDLKNRTVARVEALKQAEAQTKARHEAEQKKAVQMQWFDAARAVAPKDVIENPISVQVLLGNMNSAAEMGLAPDVGAKVALAMTKAAMGALRDFAKKPRTTGAEALRVLKAPVPIPVSAVDQGNGTGQDDLSDTLKMFGFNPNAYIRK